MDIPRAWRGYGRTPSAILGRPGIASMAISAVDNALWDLKARLLELPLVKLLGAVRDALPIYGSGGFTSYTDEKLAEQLGGWVEQGIPRVKMKVGREPERDLERVAAARAAIGDEARAFRGCERRLFAQAGAQICGAVLRVRRDAGSRNRSRPMISRACACCATRAGRHGYRGGRVRLRRDVFPPHARGGGGRCFASGRDAMRRVSPVFWRRTRFARRHICRSRRIARPRCTLHVGCAAQTHPARGIFSRSRPDRADAFRGRRAA